MQQHAVAGRRGQPRCARGRTSARSGSYRRTPPPSFLVEQRRVRDDLAAAACALPRSGRREVDAVGALAGSGDRDEILPRPLTGVIDDRAVVLLVARTSPPCRPPRAACRRRAPPAPPRRGEPEASQPSRLMPSSRTGVVTRRLVAELEGEFTGVLRVGSVGGDLEHTGAAVRCSKRRYSAGTTNRHQRRGRAARRAGRPPSSARSPAPAARPEPRAAASPRRAPLLRARGQALRRPPRTTPSSARVPGAARDAGVTDEQRGAAHREREDGHQADERAERDLGADEQRRRARRRRARRAGSRRRAPRGASCATRPGTARTSRPARRPRTGDRWPWLISWRRRVEHHARYSTGKIGLPQPCTSSATSPRCAPTSASMSSRATRASRPMTFGVLATRRRRPRRVARGAVGPSMSRLRTDAALLASSGALHDDVEHLPLLEGAAHADALSRIASARRTSPGLTPKRRARVEVDLDLAASARWRALDRRVDDAVDAVHEPRTLAASRCSVARSWP